MHDLGKIGIEDSILMKPGALTNEEWAQIRKHSNRRSDIRAVDFLKRCDGA